MCISAGQLHKAGAFCNKGQRKFHLIRISSQTVDKSTALKCDQTVRLKNMKVLLAYPETIGRIKYHDKDIGMEFTFMTNNFELSALEIARLYQYRWTIETFFRWIKQHLKIKTFWGHSFNAVKTQIYIAIITYVLISIVKHTLKLKQSQYEILQILSISLPLLELFSNSYPQYVKELNTNQLHRL